MGSWPRKINVPKLFPRFIWTGSLCVHVCWCLRLKAWFNMPVTGRRCSEAQNDLFESGLLKSTQPRRSKRGENLQLWSCRTLPFLLVASCCAGACTGSVKSVYQKRIPGSVTVVNHQDICFEICGLCGISTDLLTDMLLRGHESRFCVIHYVAKCMWTLLINAFRCFSHLHCLKEDEVQQGSHAISIHKR